MLKKIGLILWMALILTGCSWLIQGDVAVAKTPSSTDDIPKINYVNESFCRKNRWILIRRGPNAACPPH